MPLSAHPAAPPRTRRNELDFLRVLAMAAVILGHVTAAYIHNESSFTLLGMNPAFFLNQASRFSVPMFFFLSGFSLGLREQPLSYPAFLKERFLRILPPYLVWTLIYELWNASLAPRRLLRDLLTGQAAPHLYFIPILLQFYLLYPLLRRWMDRQPLGSVLWSLASTLFFQGLYYEKGLGLLPDLSLGQLWMLFPVWLFYFTAGMALQRLDRETIRIHCKENAAPLLVLLALFVCLYCALSRFTGVLDSIKPEITLFVPLVFLCGTAVWGWVRGLPGLETAVVFLSRLSMDIYYCHVLVLCLFRLIPRVHVGMSGMVLLLLATFAGSLVLAVLLGALRRLLRRIRPHSA